MLDAPGVRAGPVDPPAALAFDKVDGVSGHVGGYPVAHGVPADGGKLAVASRAAGEDAPRVEGKRDPRPDLRYLTRDVGGFEEQNPGSRGGGQTAVPGEQPPALLPAHLSEVRAHDRGPKKGVETGEAQPPRQGPEHRIAGQAKLSHDAILL